MTEELKAMTELDDQLDQQHPGWMTGETVTQADRDAVADYKEGPCTDGMLAICFAAHRLAAEAAQRERDAAMLERVAQRYNDARRRHQAVAFENVAQAIRSATT